MDRPPPLGGCLVLLDKLFFHFQAGISSWALDYYSARKAHRDQLAHPFEEWAKVMDPGEAYPLPEAPWINWIVRIFQDDYLVNQDARAGGPGAYNHWQRVKRYALARPYLQLPNFFFESHNEPSELMSSRPGREAYARYCREFIHILYNEGIQCCAGNLGVGHPEPEYSVEVHAGPMAALLEYGGIYSKHEYGWPGMTDWYENDEDGEREGWLTLRYRKDIRVLKAAGARNWPRLAFTESGIDGRIVGLNAGWRKVNPSARWYVWEQLAPYTQELQRDPYVIGHFVFSASAVEPWSREGYGVGWDVAREVLRYDGIS